MCLMLYEVETNRVWHWLLIAGVTLTGEELGIAGNSVSASDGLVSYYPEFSGFGEFRNGEPVAMQPRPVALSQWPCSHALLPCGHWGTNTAMVHAFHTNKTSIFTTQFECLPKLVSS